MNTLPKVTSSGLVVFAVLHHVALFLSFVTVLILPLSIMFWAASAVFYFLVLHRGWSLVQDGQTDVTPGRAVGFCFIPFYNLYWIFVGIAGLPKQINRVADAQGVPEAKINPAFALVSCICIATICFAPIGQIFDIVVIWQVIGAVKALENR